MENTKNGSAHARGSAPTLTGHTAMDIYRFMVYYASEHKGRTPTQRQIANHCGIKSSTVNYHIGNLIKAELLERIDDVICVARSSFVLHRHVYDI